MKILEILTPDLKSAIPNLVKTVIPFYLNHQGKILKKSS